MKLQDGVNQSAQDPEGDQIHYGIREHAMGAAMTGMALHGGVLPVGGTFFIFSDYMRPAVRLAALSESHVIYSWTHDSVGLGEDGPTHQPVEHLASLRAMPGLRVIRPADANETAHAWRIAVDSDGPTALVLTRQSIPVLVGTAEAAEGVARGGYVLVEAAGDPEIVLIGTGSEVSLCVEAARLLSGAGEGAGASGPSAPVRARVVSLPSWDLFALQPESYRHEVLPPGVTRLAVEAAASFGWERYADDVVAIDHFGASAPGEEVLAHFGYTPDNVAARARALLARAGPASALRHRLTAGHARATAPVPARREHHDQAARPLPAAGPEPVARQPPSRLPARRAVGRARGRGHPWSDVEPHHLRQGHRGRERLRRAVRRAAGVAHRRGGVLGARHHRHPRRAGRPAPVSTRIDGVDGYVSLEVAPSLAHDTAGTIKAARHFHELVDQPNLFVKIPATTEGVPAIRAMFAEGRSINITLLFSLERYDEVIEAYIGGLEDLVATGVTDLSPVRSVASFFVSRVDTEVDRRLDTLATQADTERAREILSLRGTAAVAQARRAYALFTQRFSGARWEALAARGAKVQRPLWASTSTKNPAYPDLVYVDTLIGPDTVNTMPDETIAAFLDHGKPARDRGRRSRCRARRRSSTSKRRAWTWRTWPAPSRTKGWRASPSRSTS